MKPRTLVERRTFICNAGAALSATVASTAVAGSKPASAHDMNAAESEIHRLHHTFVERLNGRRYDELGELFVIESGTQRPTVAHFDRPLPDGLLWPEHDYIVGHEQHLDTIEVAPDRRSATARFHCLTRMESELIPTLPLVDMARQQGQGVIQWWESGILEMTCSRSESDGSASHPWKISRLSFRSRGAWLPAAV